MHAATLIANRHESPKISIVSVAVALRRCHVDAYVIPGFGSLPDNHSPSEKSGWFWVRDTRATNDSEHDFLWLKRSIELG